ncbi:hypothetical protein BGZ80_006265 [Entomortierella chlamydospora]|uniref:WD40 repeat-containing protein SMU1 n=1 Tax=Entomortierella chlamydospora TaxID=101097 RepID=A0A9P6MZ14_9FUNG|nr:hypothetical protein BGZ80_006265 [Entomortierella chlamydospora]
MHWNPFSSRTTGLSPEEVLELANKYLRNAHKEIDNAKALEIISNAKPLMKDLEKTSRKDKNPVLSEGIGKAYHEHGRLLDDLGYREKARKSYRKAEEWGYVYPVGQHAGPSRPASKSGAIRRSLLPKFTLFATPRVVTGIYQGGSKSGPEVIHLDDRDLTSFKVGNDGPAPNKDVHIQQKFFNQDITPPVIKYDLPETGAWITSTPQLAYCLSLLDSSMASKEELDQSERVWLDDRVADTDEKERLQTIATDLVRAFAQEGLKKSGVVAEVVSLAAVLGNEDFRQLLQKFVDGINQSKLLDVQLLNGLTQLIRNGAHGYIEADDLIKILELLNALIKETHKQSTQHTYQLALAISQVLDSMVDSQVEELSREQLHEPLSDYFKGLQESSDPYLIYQAAYACQALLYIPDDETILQSAMRRTGKIVHGISGVVSAVKALDLIKFVEGLQNVQQGLAGAEKAIELVGNLGSNVVTLVKSGQGLLESLKEGLSLKRKSSWYPALRGLDRLVQEGRFTDFEKLAREVPCQHNPAFRWGVCQRLGEIAMSTVWSHKIRKCAVDFLIQLYKEDASKDPQVNIKRLILCILSQLTKSSEDITEGSVRELLQETQVICSPGKGGCGNDNPVLHPIIAIPPPTASPLLDRVQNKPDVETPLRKLRMERLEGRDRDVYISPRARANSRATDDFDLTTKVQEFLRSNRKVFLVLGDSGAGKSTFKRALEIDLWDKFDKVKGRIPLFIHLPAIEKPERDLISERLRRANFTESQILELKLHREFIVICDGYDESLQTRNLYMTNNLNQPGEWRAQMVISCRTEYNGVDYKHRFDPRDRNSSWEADLFQEAIISPFSKDQIQAYVEKYVGLRKTSWGPKNYLEALNQIPNLRDLVKNPFLLKLALEVLPRLLGGDNKYSPARVTRIELYDEFVSQWIERGKKRLTEMELNSHDKSTFKQLSDFGFQERGIRYLKELVMAIYEHQNGNPVVNYPEYQDQTTWKEAFFSEKDGSHLLWELVPLARNGNQYQFIHKSLLEYGLSLAVCGPSKHNEDTDAAQPAPRRHITSAGLSFGRPSSREKTATANELPLLDSPLGKRNLVDERSILQFLTERAQQEAVFKDQLHSIIERSKSDETVHIAAANAITILVRAGVHFNSADLRYVNIPGADLSFGMFDSSQLEGADLRRVNLRNVWMRQADLRGAQMEGTQFGELPFLKEDSKVTCSAYSTDGNKYAVGLEDGDIKVYETLAWNRIQTLKGHIGGITNLSFSATGVQIASVSYKETMIRLWDVDTGECIYTLQGHYLLINSIVYSPEVNQIASGGDDMTIRLWNVDTGKCIRVLQGHSSSVNGVVYSPKGDRIASRSIYDKTVRLWDVNTGECIRTFQDHSHTVSSIVYSPRGDQIASGSDDMTVRLWDVDTGECIHILQDRYNNVSSIVYSPKGDRIAFGNPDMTVRLWDVDTGKCIHILNGHDGIVKSVVYSPKGDRIASGSDDKTVRLWNVDTGECAHTLQGHSFGVSSAVYSPKGDQIASGCEDSKIRLWGVDSSECIHDFQSHSKLVRTVAYSPKGDHIASGSRDSTVRLWDVDTGVCFHTLKGHSEEVVAVAYSPKGDRIASGSDDCTVRLWDVDTGSCIHILRDHSGHVRSVVYSPKGDRIASGSDDRTVRLWKVDTGECAHILQGHSSGVNSVVYSPKGDQVASGSIDTTVRLWDVDTGECVHTLRGHSSYVSSIMYAPKGDRIASGSIDKTVRLWDVDIGECIHTLQGHSSYVSSIMYSPKGDRIASGSSDCAVRLWDVDTGECTHTLYGHSSDVNSLVYSPKGDQIASGSWDRTVRLWDAESGKCLATIRGFIDSVSSIAFGNHVDAPCVVTASEDKSDVQDLSCLNQELLIQRGALIPEALPSEQQFIVKNLKSEILTG